MKESVEKNSRKIAAFLEEHSCKDVVVLPLDECSWTDCFVIGTVNSVGHLKGVVHQILSVSNRHKNPAEDGWLLIDTGDIVIHLMSQELRSFYDLEKLWAQVR